MVQWNKVLETVGLQDVVDFASEKMSGKNFEKSLRFTEVSGEVRNLIREKGVVEARKITKKALRRRNVQV